MKTIVKAGIAIGLMASAVGCSGERPSFESQEQITEVVNPNLDKVTTTIGQIALSENTEPSNTANAPVTTQENESTIEFNTVSESCVDGEEYAPLSISKIGLGVQTMCSGDGKFLSPSIAPGSPTYEEFANSSDKSLAIIGHRTAHGGPFGQIDTLTVGDLIEFGDKTFSVASSGMIDDLEALSWLNSEIADSPTQVLGLLTCSDSLGDARGENPGQKGTENRLYVIAVPVES